MPSKARAMGFQKDNRRLYASVSWDSKHAPTLTVRWTQNEAGDEKELEIDLFTTTTKGKPCTLGQALEGLLWAVNQAGSRAPLDRDVS